VAIDWSPHRFMNPVPASSGLSLSPWRTPPWQAAHDVKYRALPRAACSLVYTPCHTELVSEALAGKTIGNNAKTKIVVAKKNNVRDNVASPRTSVRWDICGHFRRPQPAAQLRSRVKRCWQTFPRNHVKMPDLDSTQDHDCAIILFSATIGIALDDHALKT
jgi:hypothetical protein